jgi:signal transduction histidine kinase
MPTETHPKTILIVDDDRGLLRLIEKALQREGFQTATAASGKEAIAWLDQHRADLMLLDLKLPDIHAQALIAQLSAARRSLPFIVITGQGDERVAVDMMKRGALDYLVKDADFLTFLPEVARRALEQVEKDKRLAQLQKLVLEISEREQQRIGQDLHDGLGQQLTGIELMCQALKMNSAAGRDKIQLERELDRLSQHIRDAIALTRSLARGLTPFRVESSGLEIALAELAHSATVPARIRCHFRCDDGLHLTNVETAINLYRIAQEAVNNAIKHGSATAVKLELLSRNGILKLQIADNGKGFPSIPKEGLGLDIMRHRARAIGAELDLESRPGKGVTVVCTLPMNQ